MKVDLWDITNEGFMLLDADGVLVDVNRSGCRILGRDRISLIGLPIGDVFVRVKPISESFSGPSFEVLQVKSCLSDGSVGDFMLKALSLDFSRRSGFVCYQIFRSHRPESSDSDGVEDKWSEHTEEQLVKMESIAESGEKIAQRNVIDEMVCVVEFDQNGAVAYANECYWQLTGYSYLDMSLLSISSHFRSWSNGTNLPEFPFAEYEYPRKSNFYRVSVLMKSGAWKVLTGSCRVGRRDGSGKAVGLTFFGIESSETLGDFQSALGEELAFRRAVLDSSELFAVTTDRDGIVTMVNAYALERLGYEKIDLVGHKTPALFLDGELPMGVGEDIESAHQSDQLKGRRRSFFQSLLTGLRTQMSLSKQAHITPKRGMPIPVLCTLSKVVDESGRGIGYVLVAQDITELKRLEKLKSDFVSTVSHELRTPLTSINGALQIMDGHLKAALPEKLQVLVGMASRNAERLVHLVDDLLDVQKIESGRMNYDMRIVDLETVMLSTVEAMTTYASEKGVSYQIESPEKVLQAKGDQRRLEQVLMNLVSNAVKFSPENGQVRLTLKQSGSFARLSVRDQGPGIPEEFRKRIFEKFSQADGSDSKEKSGTGLGLSIAKAIVAHHHGELRFWSDPNHGTEFYFEIPIAGENNETQSLTVQERKNATVLIVEDDPDIADILRDTVEDIGYECLVARSIGEAFENLESNIVDVVTLDLVMPDQHGSVLVARMGSRPEWSHIPIVVISGYDDSQVLQSLQMRGLSRSSRAFAMRKTDVFAWLSKPVKKDTLGLALTQALEARAARSFLMIGASPSEAAMLHRVTHGFGSLVECSSMLRAVDLVSRHHVGLGFFVNPNLGDLEILLLKIPKNHSSFQLILWFTGERVIPREEFIQFLPSEFMRNVTLHSVNGVGTEAADDIAVILRSTLGNGLKKASA